MKLILPDSTVELRAPTPGDGLGLWQLVRDTGVLDQNSPYAYFLLGEHFAETCVVAEQGERIVGFVSAYIPPQTPDSIFVWQVGIAESMRKQGLAMQMILALLKRDVCHGINVLQTTITPSNKASHALFGAVARSLNAKIVEQREYFKANWFPGSDHEPESLFTIGPIHH